MWYVYMLLCDQKTFYVGMTDGLRERIIKHKSKQSLYTLRFSDIRLVYCEQYTNKYETAKREKQLKGRSHAKKQRLIDKKIIDPHCIELDEVLG